MSWWPWEHEGEPLLGGGPSADDEDLVAANEQPASDDDAPTDGDDEPVIQPRPRRPRRWTWPRPDRADERQGAAEGTIADGAPSEPDAEEADVADEWVDEPFGRFVEPAEDVEDAEDEPAEDAAAEDAAAEGEPDDACADADEPEPAPVPRSRRPLFRWPWARTATAAGPAKDVEEDEPENAAEAPSPVDGVQLTLLDEAAEASPLADGAAGSTGARKEVDGAPKTYRGYRTLRRLRKSGRSTRVAASSAPTATARALVATKRVLRTAALVILTILVLFGALYGLVVGINAFARWNARREAVRSRPSTANAQDNLLVIGVTNGQAVGFAALKAERVNHRVLGIAIPDGAFVEVPGQGFERLGDSYVQGPDISTDAVSNYLMVRFSNYVVVSGNAYQAMMKGQSVTGLMGQVEGSDLTTSDSTSLAEYFATVTTKNVWIVPLPVTPISVGDQQYFEPQRQQVADLLLQWWGVKIEQQASTPRVIVYNGVGTPGIAGLAAQQLIRQGFRIVDSGNADNFNHKKTLILLYHGTEADAQQVRSVLGAGQILVQSAPQDLTDIIVIIGADYRPPADVTTVSPSVSATFTP